jgi:hypothetical protein
MDSDNGTEIVPCPNAQCGQQLRIPSGEVLVVTCPTCQATFTHRPSSHAQRLSQEFRTKSWTLGELMIVISRESMVRLKHQAPNALGNLDRKQEWEAFIEFLKVLFNIVDRIATLYVPMSEFLQFLDAVEDAVIDHMNNAFRKQAGAAYDETPLKMSISGAFDAAQKTYQPHKFMITEESPERDRYLTAFGETLARVVGLNGNKMIVTTASMCASSSIAAIKALMESSQGRPMAAGTA